MGVDVVDPEEIKRNPKSLMGNYAYMVHVHNELISGTEFDVEGLPSSFGGFSKVVGRRSIRALQRPLDTGEILEVP
ncbi:MAG TPA: hypothetical protein VKA01_06225 [Vicinamibacteria bacterium]|nr:hypothetical protein [Vicinamibacteria bacterium]